MAELNEKYAEYLAKECWTSTLGCDQVEETREEWDSVIYFLNPPDQDRYNELAYWLEVFFDDTYQLEKFADSVQEDLITIQETFKDRKVQCDIITRSLEIALTRAG